MGTSLSGKKIKDTYDGIIKTTDNTAVGATDKELTDGQGNDLNISVNTSGDITADGTVEAASIVKTSGTSDQILLADGTTIDIIQESETIGTNDNDTSIPTSAAVKDYVDDEISDLIGGAPAALDTLNEIAEAINDNANFSDAVVLKTGSTMTGNLESTGFVKTGGTSSQFLKADGSVDSNTYLTTDNNTTYSTSAVDSGDDAIIRLTGSDSTTDDVKLVAGSNITITPSGDDITIASTAAGNSFTTIAVSGQSNVVADTSSDTLTLAAGSNITLTTDASTDTVTVASTASGGGDTVTVEKNTFTATAAQEDFTIDSEPDSVNNLQIYLDGVYQAKDNYTFSGTTVTINTGTGVEVGTSVEIIHLKVVKAKLILQSHTANGTDTTFGAGGTITNENETQVYIDGVYQSKDAYTVSGTDVDFGTGNAPASGSIVEIVHIKAGSGAGVEWDSTAKTAAFTADANSGYFVDTSSAAITVTMPSSPSAGDVVKIVDYGANAATNNITITSSDDIENSSDDKVINYNKGAVELVYSGSTKGWLVASAANESATALEDSTFDVDYLVVAGGGGGGRSSTVSSYGTGGGGAGGLRTSFGSTSGGGASAENALSIDTGTTLTITVGTGGSGSSSLGTNGGDGGASKIESSDITNVTTVGGGGGGSPTGSTGGSGGGGKAPTGSGGTGTSSEGYAGGDGGSGGYGNAGGGGGAGGAGEDGEAESAVQSSGTATGGDGGDGLNISITGTSTGYAGGGAGGITWHTYTTYPAGTHGGGSITAANAAGGNGTDGTGGGGAGGSTNGTVAANGGDGGDGIVILRYPSNRSITVGAGLTTGVLNATVSGGTDKYTTFTAGTGDITWS